MSQHLETVQTIYQAFLRGDVQTILGHLAEDVAWDQDAPGYGVPIYEPGTGHAHALRFFQAYLDRPEPEEPERVLARRHLDELTPAPVPVGGP